MTKDAEVLEKEEKDKTARVKAYNDLEETCSKYKKEINKFEVEETRNKFMQGLTQILEWMNREENNTDTAEQILEKKHYLETIWQNLQNDASSTKEGI